MTKVPIRYDGVKQLVMKSDRVKEEGWCSEVVMRTVDEKRHIHKDLCGVCAPHNLCSSHKSQFSNPPQYNL